MIKKAEKRIHPAVNWLPTTLVAAAVLWLTLAPHPLGDSSLPLFAGADKLAHAVMFGLLEATALLDLRRQQRRRLSLPEMSVTLFLVIAAGVITEVLQKAMGMGRMLEFHDMLADAFGAVVATTLWAVIAGFARQTGDGDPQS